MPHQQKLHVAALKATTITANAHSAEICMEQTVATEQGRAEQGPIEQFLVEQCPVEQISVEQCPVEQCPVE